MAACPGLTARPIDMLKQRARDRMYKRAVGVLVIASALGLLVFLRLYQQTAGQFRAPLQLHAITERADGLVVDAPVTMAGLRVGRVRHIQLTADSHVRLDLDIERQYASRLRGDSRATISRPLIGPATVDISIGADGQPQLAEGAALPTHRSPDLNDVIATLPDRLAKVDAVLADLAAVSADLRRTSREITAPGGPLERTLTHAESVARQADAASHQLGPALADAHTVVREAGKAVGDAQAVLADVRTSAAHLPALAEKLDASVDDVRAITTELRKAAPEIAPLVAAGRDTLGEADDVLQAAKKSFLLRGNLPPPAPATSIPTPR